VAGLAADYCVYYTASDAIAEGFKTFIIDDAVRAINNAGYEKAKQDIINRGGRIISVEISAHRFWHRFLINVIQQQF
jgi:nicotinamidase/pyrazinamidase